MGVVYRARDEAVGRDVALKVLMADIEDDPDIRTRFYREAEAAARLSHPNIITIFDVGEDGDRFFIVMELLRGATLKEFLKQGEADALERKLDLMIQLCAGLGAAHNASIYHRDIKPGNIFVRADGMLKILDFGVARLASSSMTAAGFIVGTPDYMSPEQARGADIDGRSDIFSLGGVFYFMLTGRKPFPASDLPTLFHQIQSEDPPPPLGVEAPPELTTLIMKALSKKRETRYQCCRSCWPIWRSLRQRFPLGGPARGGRSRTMPEAAASGRDGADRGGAGPARRVRAIRDRRHRRLSADRRRSTATTPSRWVHRHVGKAHRGSNRFGDFRRVRTTGATVHARLAQTNRDT